MPVGPLFKVKLASGRILGPLDADRVRQLILKNQIVGTETAREYPKGEWVDINSIGLIADLLIARADGRLVKEALSPVSSGYSPLMGDAGMFSTQVLPGSNNENEKSIALAEIAEPDTAAAPTGILPPPTIALEQELLEQSRMAKATGVPAEAPELEKVEPDEDNEKTAMYSPEDDERTRIADGSEGASTSSSSSADQAPRARHRCLILGVQAFEVEARGSPRRRWDRVSRSLTATLAASPTKRPWSFSARILSWRARPWCATGQARVRKPKNKTFEMVKAMRLLPSDWTSSWAISSCWMMGLHAQQEANDQVDPDPAPASGLHQRRVQARREQSHVRGGDEGVRPRQRRGLPQCGIG